MRRSALLASLLALAACGKDYGYAVEVTIGVRATVGDAALGHIRTLHIEASGAELYQHDYAISNQLSKREARWVYLPGVAGGTLRFSIAALDGNSSTLATGRSPDVTLEPGHTVSTTVELDGDSAPDGGGDGGGDLALCQDACGPVGATQCAGVQQQSCGVAGGCLGWSAPIDCPTATPACSAALARCACTVASCAASGAGCNPVSGACVACSPLPTGAVDFFVDAGGGAGATGTQSCPWPTLTQALAAATASSATSKTIHVAAGSYGAGETFPLVLRGGIAVVGAGAATTSIRGAGAYLGQLLNTSTAPSAHSTFVVGDVNANTRLSGLTLLNTTAAPEDASAVLCDRGNAPALGGTLPAPTVSLDHLTFGAGFGAGIIVTGLKDGSVPGCNLAVTASTFRDLSEGIFAQGCQGGSLTTASAAVSVGDGTATGGNLFTSLARMTPPGSYPAIFINGCVTTRIVGNSFSALDSGVALYLPQATASVDIENNSFSGLFDYGLRADGNTVIAVLRGNSFTGIGSPSSGGDGGCDNSALCLESASQLASATDNRFFGNHVGVEITGDGMSATARKAVNLGTATALGDNTFRCNSGGGLGHDVWIHLDTASDSTPIGLAGNVWDHQPLVEGAADASDLYLDDTNAAVLPTVSTLYVTTNPAESCPTGKSP